MIIMDEGIMQRKTLRAKILLIGDGGVGKSSLRRAWLGETFQTQYIMTLGADFASKEISLYYSPTETQFTIKCQIWDLAGQPRFKVVRDLYYHGAVGALCFFDITNRNSFLNVKNWIDSYWKLNGKGHRPLLLIGAKGDLRNNPDFPDQISVEEGEELAEELTKQMQEDSKFIIDYVETSAKRNTNVEKAFHKLGFRIIELFYQITQSVPGPVPIT